MYAQNYDGGMQTGLQVQADEQPMSAPQQIDAPQGNETSKNLGAFDELLPQGDDGLGDQDGPLSFHEEDAAGDPNSQDPNAQDPDSQDQSAVGKPDPKHEGDQGDGSPDLSEFIFKVVEGLGYPPRRLEEFADEFVQESIFPGNVREVTVIIPDRYYGMRKRVSSSDFAKVVAGIQQKFGLNFVSAERKQKKIIMSFSSQKPQAEGGEQVVGDDLDEVYSGGGKGGGAGKKPAGPKKPAAPGGGGAAGGGAAPAAPAAAPASPARGGGAAVQPAGKGAVPSAGGHAHPAAKAAHTHREMLKVSKNQLFDLLNKLTEGK